MKKLFNGHGLFKWLYNSSTYVIASLKLSILNVEISVPGVIAMKMRWNSHLYMVFVKKT